MKNFFVTTILFLCCIYSVNVLCAIDKDILNKIDESILIFSNFHFWGIFGAWVATLLIFGFLYEKLNSVVEKCVWCCEIYLLCAIFISIVAFCVGSTMQMISMGFPYTNHTAEVIGFIILQFALFQPTIIGITYMFDSDNLPEDVVVTKKWVLWLLLGIIWGLIVIFGLG